MKGKVKMMKSMNLWWGIFMATYWRRGQVFLFCKTVINKWKWKSLHENEDEDIQQKKNKRRRRRRRRPSQRSILTTFQS